MFLQRSRSSSLAAAGKAGVAVPADPRTTCLCARRASLTTLFTSLQNRAFRGAL
jgi:hypothetical protein